MFQACGPCHGVVAPAVGYLRSVLPSIATVPRAVLAQCPAGCRSAGVGSSSSSGDPHTSSSSSSSSSSSRQASWADASNVHAVTQCLQRPQPFIKAGAVANLRQLGPQYTAHLQQHRALFSITWPSQHRPQQYHQQHQQQQQQQALHVHLQGRQQQQAYQQLQQQRGVKQLRPYAEAPKLPPKFKRLDKDGRLNRMVIRVPPQVTLQVDGDKLTLTGKAGSTSLSLSTLDSSGLVAWQRLTQSAAAAAAGPGTGSLLLLVSPSRRHWRSIQTHIDNAVHGVMQGYLVGLTVQGVGYRLEPVADDVVVEAVRARRGEAAAAAADRGVKRRIFWELEAEKTNIAYPHKQPAKAVRLKVGFTKAAIYPLPDGVLGFFVKPTLMYLYGVDKQLVTNTAAALRAVRKPNAYTGNGIQLVGESMRLKQRAGSK